VETIEESVLSRSPAPQQPCVSANAIIELSHPRSSFVTWFSGRRITSLCSKQSPVGSANEHGLAEEDPFIILI
jgi:hypothetical protein